MSQPPANRFQHPPGGMQPDARPARLVQVPAYDPAAHLPPPPPLPGLTVSPKGVAYLSKPLMQQLGLSGGQSIDLLAPMPGSQYWHLDLRPTAARRIEWERGNRAKPQAARIKGLRLPAGFSDKLTLLLLPGPPHYPHFYPLLPAHAFAPCP